MPTTIKVFGNIKDVSRFAKRCTVTIKLINGPINEDPNLIVPTEIVRQTDSTGYFEANLGLGDYALFVGSDQILFSVADLASGDKNVVSLLVDDLTYTQQKYTSNWNGLRQGNIQFIYIARPGIMDYSTYDSGGQYAGLDGSTYRYFSTFVNSLGETAASEFLDVDMTGIIGGDGNVVRLLFNGADVTAGVTKRRIYRATTDEYIEFQIIAELDPTITFFDDVKNYSEGYPSSASPYPNSNTTAGAMYASNVLVARYSPEAGFDVPTSLRIPFGVTPSFERQVSIDMEGNNPVLNFYYSGGVRKIGKIFIGGAAGIVPSSSSGFTGTRVLQEDGSWVEPSGGGGSPAGDEGTIQFNVAGAFGSDANFFWDNTEKRLGIGTNAPSQILHVVQDSTGPVMVLCENTHDGSEEACQAMFQMKCFGDSVVGMRFGKTQFAGPYGGLAYIDQSENAPLWLMANNSPKLVILPTGNILIGSTDDDESGAKLQVVGAANVTGAIATPVNVLDYDSTISLDPSLSNIHKTTTVNATGNATINASSSGLSGQELVVIITNDATLSKIITFGTNFKTSGTIIGTASKTATIKFVSDGTNFYEVARTLALL